jgi:hypothetical protein
VGSAMSTRFMCNYLWHARGCQAEKLVSYSIFQVEALSTTRVRALVLEVET